LAVVVVVIMLEAILVYLGFPQQVVVEGRILKFKALLLAVLVAVVVTGLPQCR
jgi:hypothetical protein